MEAARNYLLQIVAARPEWRGVVPSTLYEPCRPVPLDDPQVRSVLEDVVFEMFCTLYGSFGVGLAAPQVGIRWRLAVVDTLYVLPLGRTWQDFTVAEAAQLVLINPEILETGGGAETVGTENCLSLPGHCGDVPRAEWVRIRTHRPSGEAVEFEAGGFLARVIQHEIDHLDGRTYVDRTADPARPPVQAGGRFAGRAARAVRAALDVPPLV